MACFVVNSASTSISVAAESLFVLQYAVFLLEDAHRAADSLLRDTCVGDLESDAAESIDPLNRFGQRFAAKSQLTRVRRFGLDSEPAAAGRWR